MEVRYSHVPPQLLQPLLNSPPVKLYGFTPLMCFPPYPGQAGDSAINIKGSTIGTFALLYWSSSYAAKKQNMEGGSNAVSI